jgi:hypothetical protein
LKYPSVEEVFLIRNRVDKCFEEINKLRADFEAHKEFSIQNINNLNYLMPTKADKQELIDLENRILDKLRDMIQ